MLKSIIFGELEIWVVFHELSLCKVVVNNMTGLFSFCEGQWEEEECLGVEL